MLSDVNSQSSEDLGDGKLPVNPFSKLSQALEEFCNEIGRKRQNQSYS